MNEVETSEATEPTVSVMLVCYNMAASLPMALASLQAQTFSDWECVIVDDGSTDGSADVVARFNDPRMRLIRLAENRGRPFARQVALENARGRYLAVLDADDWYMPEKLERQVAAMERHPDVTLVSTGIYVTEKGKLRGIRGIRGRRGEPHIEGPCPPCSRPPVVHGTVLFRREAANGLDFDLDLERGEDKDFLIRLLTGRNILHLNEPCYVYDEFDTITKKKILTGLESSKKIAKKYYALHPEKGKSLLREVSIKRAIYKLAFLFKVGKKIISNRLEKPCSTDMDQIRVAHNQLVGAIESLQQHVLKLSN